MKLSGGLGVRDDGADAHLAGGGHGGDVAEQIRLPVRGGQRPSRTGGGGGRRGPLDHRRGGEHWSCTPCRPDIMFHRGFGDWDVGGGGPTPRGAAAGSLVISTAQRKRGNGNDFMVATDR